MIKKIIFAFRYPVDIRSYEWQFIYFLNIVLLKCNNNKLCKIGVITGLKIKKKEYGINPVEQNKDVLTTYCVPDIWCANTELAVQ